MNIKRQRARRLKQKDVAGALAQLQNEGIDEPSIREIYTTLDKKGSYDTIIKFKAQVLDERREARLNTGNDPLLEMRNWWLEAFQLWQTEKQKGEENVRELEAMSATKKALEVRISEMEGKLLEQAKSHQERADRAKERFNQLETEGADSNAEHTQRLEKENQALKEQLKTTREEAETASTTPGQHKKDKTAKERFFELKKEYPDDSLGKL